MTWSVILHELGHLFYFRWFAGRKVEIRAHYNSWKDFGVKTGYALDYNLISKRKKFEVYFAGVFAGLLPLLISFYMNVMYGLLILIYLYCCKKDIIKMWGVANES